MLAFLEAALRDKALLPEGKSAATEATAGDRARVWLCGCVCVFLGV